MSLFQRRHALGLQTRLLLACVLFAQIAWAQLPKLAASQPAPTPSSEKPQDPLGRTTPRGTVLSFLAAAYDHKYDVAAQYLDTRSHPKDPASLAQQLFYVLDRQIARKIE